MDERRVADYFVVAGLPDSPELLDDLNFSDCGQLKANHDQAPITDIGVIFPELGETLPSEYELLEYTPSGLSADLNHGSLRNNQCFLCYRRGRDKPPLVDIGVMYEGKEYLLADAGVVKESVGKHIANVNNSTAKTFITYRRAQPAAPCNALVVTDICIIITNKNEAPPHAFCCINKNLNKGFVGSDVYLCYKKSMNRAPLLSYKPEVLSRYPISDLAHFPFPHSVPMFCLPMGSTLEMWPTQASQPRPVFSTFVLTVSDAKHKVYGSALTFYEKFPVSKLTPEQAEQLKYNENSNYVLNANKSICVLSHWPFSDTFERWLTFLYEKVISGEPQSVPVERYIVQLLEEVPFPGPRTLLQLTANSPERVVLTQPEDLPLPRSAAGFKHLLLNLGAENCLQVLILALTEQKILIHSLRPDTLTAAAEAVSSLLFPFKWQCPYIPLCPLGLVEVLHAPLPFLIGVDSRFFDLYDPPTDVSCIDLDTNFITLCEAQKHLNIKLLPKRAAKALRTTLDQLYMQLRNTSASHSTDKTQTDNNVEKEFQRRRKEQTLELEIQEAFLKFMAWTLKGYRNYLLPITRAPTVGTTDAQALFQIDLFLRSRDKTHHKFFSLLMRTQMFTRFIEERSFVADGDLGLAFFDECTERLTNEESTIRLLEPEMAHSSERTVLLLPPEPPAQGGPYMYGCFELDPMLLISKHHNQLSSLYPSSIAPGSPMARRTKHEIKCAQKFAKKCIRSPELWARCLLGTCYSLYFMTLPSMLSLCPGRERAVLRNSYDLLGRAARLRLTCDEVCYRLMMQLCGEHSMPLLAVKLLLLMKRSGIQPNALTYGLYNRCVLEAEWPAHSSSSQLLWNKLRYVVLGAAHFRRAGLKQASRRLHSSTEGSTNLLDQTDRMSRSSLDSHETTNTIETGMFDRFRSKVTSIVRSGNNDGVDAGSALTSAGLLISGIIGMDASEDAAKATPTERALNMSLTPPETPSENLRILARSESFANDARILDKLQSIRKPCARNLQFDEETEDGSKSSPSKVSPRTPVTENDPLGALQQPNTPPPVVPSSEMPFQSPVIPTDTPVLFRSSVQRSATFEGSPPTQTKGLHRSETVPASSVSSSLASLSSSLKMNFSPSNLTSKKSNEIIQGGISSLKSAATSVAKKLDEIKEAISTTSTPVKVNSGGERTGGGDSAEGTHVVGEGDSTDGSEGGEGLRRVSTELNSYKGSIANLRDVEDNLPDNMYPQPTDSASAASENDMELVLTSCSQCHNCSALLYDEEIMCNWSAEDSNLNTKCHVCGKPTVPLLTVSILQPDCSLSDPFSVPYLNPLVLRKELENILAREGDLCLSDSNFVDDHPIIYWNLVWAFERANVQSHLPNLCLKNSVVPSTDVLAKEELLVEENEKSTEKNDGNSTMILVENGTDPLTQELVSAERSSAQVAVRCIWDDPRLHGEGPPMYLLWHRRDTASPLLSALLTDQTNISKNVMQNIIGSVRCNDLLEPLKRLANERQKLQIIRGVDKTHSTYRDILFLAFKVLGRSNIDLIAFDKEYASAFERLPDKSGKLYRPQDKPLNLAAIYCRHYFKPLTLP
ncbi:Calmodulin-binding protein related to a Rab3 GDP/GTP exchange protein [Carabus blaptoides fortunei]